MWSDKIWALDVFPYISLGAHSASCEKYRIRVSMNTGFHISSYINVIKTSALQIHQ